MELAHLGGQHGLRGSRQRGVAHGQRLIVREVARFLLWRERVAVQLHRQDEVGLFDYLLTIEVKVVEVQEQRVLIRRGGSEVPHLVLGKGLILWGHFQALVVGDEHLLGCLAPAGGLIGIHAKGACLLGMALHRLCRPAQIVLGHEVGVDVVVGQRAILIGSGDAIDAKPVGGGVEAE